MRLYIALAIVLLGSIAQAAEKPDWAYAPNPAPTPFVGDLQAPQTLPGSNRQFTVAQTTDRFAPPDWYPEEHPQMPKIVATGGPRPAGVPCALCHQPNGGGRPESATIAGQTETYIIRQMLAFKNGDRSNVRAAIMAGVAKALSDEEIQDAAKYYAGLKQQSGNIKVVETSTVSKTFIGNGGMRMKSPGDQTEPLQSRIINIPEDVFRAEKLRDPKAIFVDYVPQGSIKRGEQIAQGDGGKITACSVCHGADFKGLGDVPGIAGQHALYIYRQLRDIRDGDRKGGNVALMASVVAPLSDDDMIALAAYMASRGQ